MSLFLCPATQSSNFTIFRMFSLSEPAPVFFSAIPSESSDSCLTHLDLFCPFPGVRACMNQFKLARRNSQQPAYVQILCPNHQYGKTIEKTYT